MATLVLSVVGNVAGTAIGGPLGGQLGQALGAMAGAAIDRSLFGPGAQRREGPRLAELAVQSSTEGAPIAETAGRVRLSGQVIWAARFLETATTETVGGGGKGGGGGAPKQKRTSFSYSASFAVALCEGPIDRLGTIWADGRVLDLDGLEYRLHPGGPDQAVDPLIAAIEGEAPAYRGTAYVVFEDLPLEAFGNRLPQLSFEVFRTLVPAAVPSLESLVTAVTLIPGAGERALDPVLSWRRVAEDGEQAENGNAGRGAADLDLALDALQAELPQVATVFLVAGWFGDDLRLDHCTIRPKVEIAGKETRPSSWRVHGLSRDQAALVSTIADRPAYGGTPSDDALVRAIRELRRRGLAVVFYPFLFMDIPAGNSLPDPYGGGLGQPPYPWRGRLTVDPAPGRPGSPDGSAAVTALVASFFGAATAADIELALDGDAVAVSYGGPAEWSYRRFVFHYARLCAALNDDAPGSVAGFLVGSELRGLTTLRDGPAAYPAVAQLRSLCAEVKALLGSDVVLSYAADWSEYFGHQPQDGSGDVFFHLDPLWADPAVDRVAIDCYLPLSDWRDGPGHLDAAAGWRSPYDRAYLDGQVEGGEYFDWFYPDEAARAAQFRQPIADGAHGKDWVFRPKGLAGWWANTHYDRPGGVEAAIPTAWVPQSKPLWLTEAGIPSVDKGTNQPNVFFDPKSSESALPHFSNGRRDDLIQRRGLEALLGHWRPAAGHNPLSTVYGGRMIAEIAVWTWDARPYPAWPARDDVWGDGGAWPLGHWLTGKLAVADLAELVRRCCARTGFTAIDVSALDGLVGGYLRDRPLSPRVELEALMAAFAFDAVDSAGLIRFQMRGTGPAVQTLDPDRLAMARSRPDLELTRAPDGDLPAAVRLLHVDGLRDYRPAAAEARRLAGRADRELAEALPLVLDAVQAQAIAERHLAEAWIAREQARFRLPPSALAVEPGDLVTLGDTGPVFRVLRVTDGGVREIEAAAAAPELYGPVQAGPDRPGISARPLPGRALLEFLDLALLDDRDDPVAPRVAASASPFRPLAIMDSADGTSFVLDTLVEARAVLGETLEPLAAAPPELWDEGNRLRLRLLSGTLHSCSREALLAGPANALALRNAAGEWEIVQFADAALIAPLTYELSGLLRGRRGTEQAMGTPLAAAARVVLLDRAVVPLDAQLAERNVPRAYRWGPAARDPGDPSWDGAGFTLRCVAARPLSPVHLTGRRNGAGDLAIAWVRRSRLGALWADGADAPLGEEAERYEVEILDGAIVRRTLTAAGPGVTYPASAALADFGGLPATVTVRVYQLSATVGRGLPAQALL